MISQHYNLIFVYETISLAIYLFVIKSSECIFELSQIFPTLFFLNVLQTIDLNELFKSKTYLYDLLNLNQFIKI